MFPGFVVFVEFYRRIRLPMRVHQKMAAVSISRQAEHSVFASVEKKKKTHSVFKVPSYRETGC